MNNANRLVEQHIAHLKHDYEFIYQMFQANKIKSHITRAGLKDLAENNKQLVRNIYLRSGLGHEDMPGWCQDE